MTTEPSDPAEAGEPMTLAVVLAAGAGSRFEGPGHKLAARVGSLTIAEAAIAAAAESRIGDVVVVTGAAEVPIPDSPTGDGAPVDIVAIHNPDWAEGQSTSLRRAVREAERRGVDAIVVGLADQPFVTPEAWRRVAASSSPIAVATYADQPRNPVRLHRSVWGLLPTSGDAGARVVTRVRPDLVEAVPCPGSPADIDTLEDLRTWQSRSSTNSS